MRLQKMVTFYLGVKVLGMTVPVLRKDPKSWLYYITLYLTLLLPYSFHFHIKVVYQLLKA